MIKYILLSFVCLGILSACKTTELPEVYQTPTAKDIQKSKNALTRLSKMYEGYFSNEVYAEAMGQPRLAQDIMARRIWRERTDAHWIYLSWYKTDLHTMPIAELIIQIEQIKPDTFSFTHYRPPISLPFSEVWKAQDPLRQMSPSDLHKMHNCAYRVVRETPTKFHLLPNKTFCDFDANSYFRWADIEVILEPNALHYYTTFYNKDKEVIVDYDKNTFIRQDFDRLLKHIQAEQQE